MKLLCSYIVLLLTLRLIEAALCPIDSALLNGVANEEPQYIASPNHPGSYGVYGKRLSCTWNIAANSSYDDVIIRLVAHNSSLEPATGCFRDSVEVIDGSRNFHRPLKTWCGSTLPDIIDSTGPNIVLVNFNTDFKNNDFNGFFLSYWIEKKPQLLVNWQPWTAINYVLMVMSVIILGGIPGTLFVIFIIREVIPRIMARREKKMN